MGNDCPLMINNQNLPSHTRRIEIYDTKVDILSIKKLMILHILEMHKNFM